MFKCEGDFEVTVMDAFMEDSYFQPKPGETNSRREPIVCIGDVMLKVQDAEGNNDIWRGELSNRTGIGNYADTLKTDLTLKTLQDIGFYVKSEEELIGQFVRDENGDVSIPNLIGLKCVAHVEPWTSQKTGKTYFRIKYLNGSGIKKMKFDEFMRRIKSATTPAPAAPAPVIQQTAPAAPVPPPCPYDR